jgi:hypothetical protein
MYIKTAVFNFDAMCPVLKTKNSGPDLAKPGLTNLRRSVIEIFILQLTQKASSGWALQVFFLKEEDKNWSQCYKNGPCSVAQWSMAFASETESPSLNPARS